MEWQIILALVLAIPIILFPLAFIWYLNVSGLYRVIRDARQRERRRREALRKAEESIPGKAVISEAVGPRKAA